MAHVNGNDTQAAQPLRYETPTFDPRCAFSWTLRAGEIARLGGRRQRDGHANRPATVEQASQHPGRV
jgi:hypothetical protein